MVLLAYVQGAEHDRVRVVKLAGAASDLAQRIERAQQLLRLRAQCPLDGRQQALSGGAGLGILAGVDEVYSSLGICSPPRPNGGGDLAHTGPSDGNTLVLPALLPARGLVGGDPVRALRLKSGAQGGFLFRARRRVGAG